MKNIYESVSINKQKSLLVIALFVVFIMGTSYVMSKGLAYYYGYESTGLELAGIALIFSGIMSFASYYFSDKIILSMSGARPASRKQDFMFYTVTENLCLGAGIPVPKLYVIDDTALNAFATGRDPQHAAVCVTTGLLSSLNRTELEGVVGHELAHVINYDTRLMAIVTVLLGIITLLADWMIRASWFGGGRSRDRDDKGGGGIFLVLGLLLAILAPIIGQLIQLAVSRSREYLADAYSVKLTRQPGGLISALNKLGADTEPLEVANKATAHLYMVDPLRTQKDAVKWFSQLFNTHPPLQDRIKALEKMA